MAALLLERFAVVIAVDDEAVQHHGVGAGLAVGIAGDAGELLLGVAGQVHPTAVQLGLFLQEQDLHRAGVQGILDLEVRAPIAGPVRAETQRGGVGVFQVDIVNTQSVEQFRDTVAAERRSQVDRVVGVGHEGNLAGNDQDFFAFSRAVGSDGETFGGFGDAAGEAVEVLDFGFGKVAEHGISSLKCTGAL